MNYNVLYDNADESVIERLMKIRKIEDDLEDFMNPTFARYRGDQEKLHDFEKGMTRILSAIENNEKIMVFGDYDVDGISASYVVYVFFQKFLCYKNISIQLPSRLEDGYGMKIYHLDQMKEKGVDLIITVDNGITAIAEAAYAKEIGIDMVITDHHQPLDTIPDAVAVINPQISPDYAFKEICGATVAFKLIAGLTTRLIKDPKKKQEIFNFFMPIVGIATVADCMPLVNENRLLVKTALDLMNRRKGIPESISNFLDYLNIKWPIDTFHIGFQIAPRLNAGWRMMTPYDSLYVLLHTGDKQLRFLENLDNLNTERRKIQENAYKYAVANMDNEQMIIFTASDEFHEGVIGIVAGKLTEKFRKPSIVLSIDKTKWHAVASLRGPEYFSVIDMLYDAAPLLERYGGHKQAWWLTVKIENLEELQKRLYAYTARVIEEHMLQKTISIDTELYHHELTRETVESISCLAPFGQWNEEPIFLINQMTITHVEKVGKTGAGHLKLHVKNEENLGFHALFWGEWGKIDEIEKGKQTKLIGTLKKDDFNGGVFIDWKLLLS